MLSIGTRLTNPETIQHRQNILSWANLVLKNLCVKKRTQELALMLLDALIFQPAAARFRKELLCTAAVIFVMKFERDFNENMREFSHFIATRLKLTPSEFFECECFVLQTLPERFGQWVGFSEVLKSLLCMSELNAVAENELGFIADAVTNAYIKGEGALSLDNLFVNFIAKAYFPKRQATQKRSDLLKNIKKYRRKEKAGKAAKEVKFRVITAPETSAELLEISEAYF